MLNDFLLLQKEELTVKLREEYVERSASIADIGNGLIRVVIGSRRAGKSHFAAKSLERIGNFGYVNFDDENLLKVQNYEEIISSVNSVYSNPKTLLLDEVQNLQNWELLVNKLQRRGFNLIVTGSNSKLLSSELATHLTGRHVLIVIFPFSFKEFLKFKEKNKELIESEKTAAFYEYLIRGGYPEPLVKGIDFKEYLNLLINATIYKDIVKRYKIRAAPAIENLCTYLLSNAALPYSYSTLKQVTLTNSTVTIQKYLKYLEETFMLFEVTRFSFKVKEQLKSQKKIYAFDNGLISSKAVKITQDLGRRYENLVAIELKRQEMQGKIKFYYWKNVQNEEVDFIVKRNLEATDLIQVCSNLENPDTKKREIRALLKASQELKCKSLTILTENYEACEEQEWFGFKAKVNFKPTWKWLLEQS